MRREAWLALLILVAFAVGGCAGTSAIIPAAIRGLQGRVQGHGGRRGPSPIPRNTTWAGR